MKLSLCASCGELLHFENIACRVRRAARLHPRRPLAHHRRAAPRRHRGVGHPAGRALAPLRQRRGARSATGWSRRTATDPPATPAGSTAPSPTCRSRKTSPIGARSNAAKRRLRLCAAALRPADRLQEGRRRPRPRLRLPRRQPRRAGDDRARQRPDHRQHLRGRLGRARAPRLALRRALPHAARPPAPRGRRTTTGTCSSTTAAASTRAGRCSATSAKLRRGAEALLRSTGRRPAGRTSTSAPTRRRTPGRTSPRPGPTICTWSTPSTPARASASRQPRASARTRVTRRYRLRSLQPPTVERLMRRVAAADGRGQQPQPQHGPARPLSLRPEPERAREGGASSTTFFTRRQPSPLPRCRPAQPRRGRARDHP